MQKGTIFKVKEKTTKKICPKVDQLCRGDLIGVTSPANHSGFQWRVVGLMKLKNPGFKQEVLELFKDIFDKEIQGVKKKWLEAEIVQTFCFL